MPRTRLAGRRGGTGGGRRLGVRQWAQGVTNRANRFTAAAGCCIRRSSAGRIGGIYSHIVSRSDRSRFESGVHAQADAGNAKDWTRAMPYGRSGELLSHLAHNRRY